MREVLARHKIDPPQGNIAGVILVQLTHNDATPYVTWIEGRDKSTFWGHYFRTLKEAEADYQLRTGKSK